MRPTGFGPTWRLRLESDDRPGRYLRSQPGRPRGGGKMRLPSVRRRWVALAFATERRPETGRGTHTCRTHTTPRSSTGRRRPALAVKAQPERKEVALRCLEVVAPGPGRRGVRGDRRARKAKELGVLPTVCTSSPKNDSRSSSVSGAPPPAPLELATAARGEGRSREAFRSLCCHRSSVGIGTEPCRPARRSMRAPTGD